MTGKCFRILGIDPGLETTGVSILDIKGAEYHPVYSGCIVTKRNCPLCTRLKKIFNEVSEIIDYYRPEYMAVEDLFFSSNTKTALSVGHSRGVLILAGSIRGLKIYEYTPLEIKQAVVGYGRATKKQIKYIPGKDDAWDAMAVSICHASNLKFRDKTDYNGRLKTGSRKSR